MTAGSQPSTAVVLTVVSTLIVLGLVADARLDPAGVAAPLTADVALQAGSSTCAAMVVGDDADVIATTVAWQPDGEDPGSATLRLASSGDVAVLGDVATDGGAQGTVVFADGTTAPAALTARWEDTPLLLSRRWSVDETERVPGTVEGPCPDEPATEWVVPGVATAGGAAATLHLANPTPGPASLSVTFTTPDGPIAPTRLANLAVAPNGQITVDLNQFVPEEPDLGVVVQTRAGRIVAEAVQTLEAAVGGVDGRALVPAHPSLAEEWTIPWVRAGDGDTAWVWVTNPGEEATDVRLVLHTATGPLVPPDSGVTLPPGATERIDLRGALAEVGTAAVTVRSAPGVPIAASGVVVRAVEEDPIRSGVTVVEALPASAGPQAALSAVGADGRERRLQVANPGDQDAVVDVRVVGVGPATEELVATGLVVPAGATADVEVGPDLPLEGRYAVLVEPRDGGVAAALVGTSLEGPLDLLSIAARPFRLTVQVIEPTVGRERSLLHPLDTEGLAPAPVASPAPVTPSPSTEDPVVP